MKRLSLLVMAVFLFVASACDSAAPEPGSEEPPLEPNTFVAQLRGAATADIEGTVTLGFEDEYEGYFIQLDSAHVIEDGTYTLIALNADDTPDRLSLIQFGDGLAEITYPVISGPVNPDTQVNSPYPFQILYSGADDLWSKASSGSVVFTTATSDALAGSFEFVGTLNGDELRISGAFSAERRPL